MKNPLARLLPFALLAVPLAAGAVTPADVHTVVVRSAGGSKSFTIVENGNAIEIVLPGGVRLLGEPAGEKRKYRRGAGGPPVCEVKPGDAGFKLRTTDGKLLWKVKLADDKIKVSDNEENANPYSIKLKYPDKAKVVDAAEKELAEVRFGPDKTKVKGADGAELWECRSPRRRTASFGVLVLERIPEEHRAILMAEILARRR
ncbi:MAG TPA: hypothetical protein PLP50_03060 [Thermoanaerobaculia bacterium]|nr:hypothetical protein [Thermoanaerobaculia bacterium]HQN06462.1 hypothetical protein [Thermoanaerobaculia bacterium]